MIGRGHRRAAPDTRFETGTACLSLLIVITMGTGVMVLSTSIVATVLVVLAVIAVLGFVVL
ncbi:hypothetical protein [Nocardia asteroides]|uniref:hypothetical protein n=1 Tax=Nocardia asteroides TaxID=1824 RepID=UPI001E2AA887|nr:hypothetical protein [Nocardia asteroides]UGT62280.1 hypothetical protein LTT61_02735 [Nocardia asteroides]